MSSCRRIKRLLETVDVASRLGGTRFSEALGLTSDFYANKSADELWFHVPTKTLHVQVPLKESILLSSNNSEIALSTFLTMIDDITSWALILGDLKRGRGGVSIFLRNEWCSTLSSGRLPGDVVEIQASVKKIGQNIGFVQAQIKDVATGQTVCRGSHIKYLPAGQIMDFMVSSYGWDLSKKYAHFRYPDSTPAKGPFARLFDSLQYPANDHATFQPHAHHASFGGPLHGGCQAVLMELAATHYVQSQCQGPAQLQSIEIQYMTRPSKKEVSLKSEIYPVADGTSKGLQPVQVQLMSKNQERSVGLLHFQPSSQ